MKAGIIIGSLSSALGIFSGGYFGISQIFEHASAHQITPTSAGSYLISVGIIIGISFLIAAIIVHRSLRA